MTMPCERLRSIIHTGDFLRHLSKNPSLPESIRREAKHLLRHYSHSLDRKLPPVTGSYQSSVEEQKTGPYVPIPIFFACSSIRPACSTSYLVGK
ncbi:hypothetical protein D3C85_1405710 [compost metagenome]